MTSGREKAARVLFFAAVFLAVCVFYMRGYPLILSSPDDWRYINYWRDFALTFPGRGWNPGRILPETMMPFGARLGIVFLYPLTGDFVRAVSCGLILVVALAVVLYLYAFTALLRSRFQLKLSAELFLALSFLLFHFWILRSAVSGNTYLLDGQDPNLYFFYIIPYLLNFTVCFFWEARTGRGGTEPLPALTKGMLFLAAYLAIFSNMLCSIVLAVYAGVRGLSFLIENRKGGKSLRDLILSLKYELLVLVLWLYSLVSEATGGNAMHITADAEQPPFLLRVGEAALASVRLAARMNKYFALFSAVMILVLIAAAARRGEYRKLLFAVALHAALVWLYQILLGGVVGSDYISRAMVSATYLVDLLLLDIGGMAWIVEKREGALAAAPVFVLVVVSMISTSAPVFRYSAGETAMIERRDNYFLEVISEADKAGEDRAVITTPPWYPGVISDDSGLYAEYLSSTLYKYGITTKRMEIVFETD